MLENLLSVFFRISSFLFRQCLKVKKMCFSKQYQPIIVGKVDVIPRIWGRTGEKRQFGSRAAKVLYWIKETISSFPLSLPFLHFLPLFSTYTGKKRPRSRAVKRAASGKYSRNYFSLFPSLFSIVLDLRPRSALRSPVCRSSHSLSHFRSDFRSRSRPRPLINCRSRFRGRQLLLPWQALSNCFIG